MSNVFVLAQGVLSLVPFILIPSEAKNLAFSNMETLHFVQGDIKYVKKLLDTLHRQIDEKEEKSIKDPDES